MNFVPICYHFFSQVSPFDRDKHLRQILSLLPISLFQHSHSTFVIIRFGRFRRLCVNLTMCEWALLPKPTTTLGLLVQAFWRVPSFTKWVIASSSKEILARRSRHSTTRTFTSGTSGLRWFSLILPHERIRWRIWWWTFTTLIHIVAETTIVSFHTLPVDFSVPTISKNSLYTLFCPLILDHGVLLKLPFLATKFLFRKSWSILLFTIAFNLWWAGPNFFWWVSRSYNSNTVFVSQTLVILICTILPRCHHVGFLSKTIKFRAT